MNIQLIIRIILVSVIYFLSAKAVAPLSLVESGSVFAIWPPTGIAFSALFLFGSRVWPGIFIGAFALNLSLSPLLPSLQIAATNTIGPLVGFWLFNKFTNSNIFDNTKAMVVFFMSIITASTITASGGFFALWLNGLVAASAFENIWIGWFLGDLIGFLLITPIIESAKIQKEPFKHILSFEGFLMLALLTTICLIIFGPLTLFDLIEYPVVYLLLPILIWGTLRFGSSVAVLSLLLVAIASMYGTILQYGPFLREEANHSLVLLQSFNGMLAITILLISSVFREKEIARVELNNHKENLEDLVFKRTLELENSNNRLMLSQKELESINLNLEETIKEEVSKNREKDQQLLLSGKMAVVGDMLGNIAHQWRQPLATISMEANNILAEIELELLEEKSLKKRVLGICDQSTYLSNTIDTFRDFIKEHKECKEIILQDSIDKSVDIVNASLKNNFITLKKSLDYENPINIKLLENEFAQVIINILNNAKDAILTSQTEDKWVELSLIKKKDIVLITIEDSGGGIDDSIKDKIFEPYFTTKEKNVGTGLGLNISYRIVTESLNGKLYIKNTSNGAKFCIELPLD